MVESVIINLKITRLDFSAESQLLIAEEFQTLKIHPHLDWHANIRHILPLLSVSIAI